ncbi:MAG: acyltransferase family protein [Eubacteriales bacterium]|nr:acyltransferase family protein [Eubacteriales bacterium]
MKTGFSRDDTNIVKGVAIISMMFHHCFVTNVKFAKYGVSFAPFSQGRLIQFALWAKVCVGIFVFLSAYGITISLRKLYDGKKYNRENLSWMTVRRIWKILTGFWPIYIIVIIGCKIWAPASFAVYKSGISRIIYILFDFFAVSEIFDTPKMIGTWWYLGLAFMEILVLPFLYAFYRRYGAFITITLSYFLPYVLGLSMTNFLRYLPTMVLGIWFAQDNLFPVIRRWELPKLGILITRIVEFIFLLAVILFSVWMKTSKFGKAHTNISDSIAPMAVILFTYLFLSVVPIVRNILKVLGVYSMNIFLFHNFIRARWFEGFTYSFRYWWLITLVLLLDTFVFSVIVEVVKKYSGYERLVSYIEGRLQKMIMKK